MSHGLDSLGATELIQTLGETMSINLEPTALFDHPTISTLRTVFDPKPNSCIGSSLNSPEQRVYVSMSQPE